MSKIKDDYRQYGLGGFLKRVIKWPLRKIGITINSYYFMVNDIDYEKQKQLFEAKGLRGVKELKYDDFLKGDKSEFTDRKLSKIRQRLDDGNYHAYGIVENDKLVYSCWISLYWLDSSNACVEGPLKKNECLLFDAYCAPEGRGRGFHSTMNSFRLMKAYEMGKNRSVVIVLKENTPAYKSQLKTGNIVLFEFYVINVWDKVFTNYFKKRKATEGS